METNIIIRTKLKNGYTKDKEVNLKEIIPKNFIEQDIKVSGYASSSDKPVSSRFEISDKRQFALV